MGEKLEYEEKELLRKLLFQYRLFAEEFLEYKESISQEIMVDSILKKLDLNLWKNEN